jgi:hypothetical protein
MIECAESRRVGLIRPAYRKKRPAHALMPPLRRINRSSGSESGLCAGRAPQSPAPTEAFERLAREHRWKHRRNPACRRNACRTGCAQMRRLAEGSATVKEIAAISGDKTLHEIERYTAGADQKLLSRRATARLKHEPEVPD